jgi:hypothetical protein
VGINEHGSMNYNAWRFGFLKIRGELVVSSREEAVA